MRSLANLKDDYGAAGDGTTDDTAAIQAALSSGRPILVPPGHYLCGAVAVAGDVHVEAKGAATIAALGDPGDLWSLAGSNLTLAGLTFEGPVSTTLGSVPPVVNLLHSHGAGAAVNLFDLNMIGGQVGALIDRPGRLMGRGLNVESSYLFGFQIQGGCGRALVSGFRARGVGINNGFKLTAGSQAAPYQSIALTDFAIEDCGRLDPSAKQDGIDINVQSLDQLSISNGYTRNCAAGGIELKLANLGDVPPNFSNVSVENVRNWYGDTGARAVALNWTGNPLSTPDLAHAVRLKDITGIWTGSGPSTGTNGIAAMAWTDVQVVGGYFEGLVNGISFSGTGSSDNTVRRPRVQGATIRGVQYGIYHQGPLVGAVLVENDIEAAVHAVYGQQGDVRLERNSLKSGDDGVRWDAGTVNSRGNSFAVGSGRAKFRATAATISSLGDLP